MCHLYFDRDLYRDNNVLFNPKVRNPNNYDFTIKISSIFTQKKSILKVIYHASRLGTDLNVAFY
jgi:hypothetical protein